MRHTDVADWQANFQDTPNDWQVNNDTAMVMGDDPEGRVGHRILMKSVNEFLVIGGMQNGITLVPEVHVKSGGNNFFTELSLTLPGGDTELMKRAFFGATVTEDATHKYIIAGGHGFMVSEHEDVMTSSDGETWTQVATDADGFLPRSYFPLVTVDSTIYAIGGSRQEGGGAETIFSDVWKSEDYGATWTQVTADGGFGARYDHSAFVHQDCLWVAGGINKPSGSPVYLKDVWKSCDGGVNWARAIESAPFADRRARVAAISNAGLMCAVGGSNSDSSLMEAIVCSYDGAVWFTLNSDPGIARDDLEIATSISTLFIFGGTDSSFTGPPMGYPNYGSWLGFF